MTRGKVGGWTFTAAVGLALWPYLVGEARHFRTAEKNAGQIRREMLRQPEPWVPARNLFEIFAGGPAEEAESELDGIEVEPEPEPEAPAAVELSGILLAGESPLAILNGSAYGVGEAIRDQQGTEIGRVVAIRAQQVVVSIGRREVEIKLQATPTAPARPSRSPRSTGSSRRTARPPAVPAAPRPPKSDARPKPNQSAVGDQGPG
ncbi:MAG: hypothetical protein HZA54_12420 [Planctomycetes bacterium]|nr:hypothetical protein [Planctomycetota bacterium]